LSTGRNSPVRIRSAHLAFATPGRWIHIVIRFCLLRQHGTVSTALEASDESIDPSKRLATIAAALRKGDSSPKLNVRAFLSWFGYQRRTVGNVWWMRNRLSKAGLATSPDFESTWIDGEMSFVLAEQRPKAEADKTEPHSPDVASTVEEARPPPAAISKLKAASNPPVRVTPDSPLSEAVTIMLRNDFSQVPVMPTEREVKGVVTWQSIGSRLALGRKVSTAREVMDAPVEIRPDASIFSAIPVLAEHGYVLVRDSEQRIAGIVTSTDLNDHFQQLTEPFILLSEIEARIRNLIEPRSNRDELASARDPDDNKRVVESVDDMNFGEYIRLLEQQDRWGRLQLSVDRKHFIEALERVRNIRNNVMHFDPDPIPMEDTRALRDFVRFLQKLETIGVTGR
jgi:CBS domain-containing protein